MEVRDRKVPKIGSKITRVGCTFLLLQRIFTWKDFCLLRSESFAKKDWQNFFKNHYKNLQKTWIVFKRVFDTNQSFSPNFSTGD